MRTAPDIKAMRLVWLGWESLAAKVVGDELMGLAKKAAAASQGSARSAARLATDPYDIVALANRAEAMARLAGCGRRIFKAVTVGAMWNPDPQLARLRLLGELSVPQALDSLEPGLHRGLAASMLCCELRARIDGGLLSADEVTRSPGARGELAESMDAMLEECGFHQQHRARALDDYWLPVMPGHLSTIAMALKDCEPFHHGRRP